MTRERPEPNCAGQSGLSAAACIGQGPLFESTDLLDHVEAAAICATCPARLACDELLEVELRSTLRAYGGGPSGTWAGRLVGTNALPREHGTDRGYFQHRKHGEMACAECKSAHVHSVTTKAKVAS